MRVQRLLRLALLNVIEQKCSTALKVVSAYCEFECGMRWFVLSWWWWKLHLRLDFHVVLKRSKSFASTFLFIFAFLIGLTQSGSSSSTFLNVLIVHISDFLIVLMQSTALSSTFLFSFWCSYCSNAVRILSFDLSDCSNCSYFCFSLCS